jgi:hypothetical protein
MQVIHAWNPLILSTDRKVVDVEPGLTPAEVIARCGLSFVRPYYLLVNGEPVGRAEWGTRRLAQDDVCHFVELPGGPYIAMAVYKLAAWMVAYGGVSLKTAMFVAKGVAFVAQTVAVVGGMQLLNGFLAGSQPGQSGAIGATDQPFSISAQGNRARIGQPFAEHFGRLKIYPDLVQKPYVEYGAANALSTGADQYLYFLGIIGMGEYDVERVLIDSTDVDNLEDADYAILGPGVAPTICTRCVWSNENLAGQKLNYASTDTTPLITAVCPPGCQIELIGFDIEFPAGLYVRSGDPRGGLHGALLSIKPYARLIDDDGSPTGDGSWTNIIEYSYPGLATNALHCFAYTPKVLRASYLLPAPFGWGRYELKLEGVDDNIDNMLACSTCFLGQVRGYGWGHQWISALGDCTCLEMRVKADAQVTGAIVDKIAVVATRKLYPVEAAGFGATLTATRSIVDAVAYMVTDANGGQQADSLLDFASLSTLRGALGTAGYYFDHRFQSRSSVMEACATAGRCGLCVPYMPGLFMLIQDVAHAACSMKFTADDYTEGSFTITHSICTADSPTGVEIHCVDADTWSDTVIECYDGDGSDTNLAAVELTGCTSRQQGYEVGMYMYADDKENRSFVEFATGLQGLIPLPGARVMIDIPAADGWQRSGLIQSIVGTTITLSEDIDWGDETDGILYLTGAAAALAGPYAVERTANEHVVTGSLPVGTATVATGAGEAARYLFAFDATETTSMRVTRIQPDGQNSVRISGTIYGTLPYADPGTVPGTGTTELLESVTLQYQGVVDGEYTYVASWAGTATEVRIEIDEGAGYSIEQDNYDTAAYYAFTIATATTISVRITPYDGAVLESEDAIVEAYVVPGPVADLALDGSIDDGAYSLTWTAVAGTDTYLVTIEAGGAIVATLYSPTNSLAVTYDDMVGAGGPYTDWTVAVASMIDGDTGMADELELDYDGWDPTALTATAKDSAVLIEATYAKTASFEALEIWMSASNDRALAVKVGETGSGQYLVTGLENNGTYYFWVRVRLTGGKYTVWYPFGDEDGVECRVSFTPAAVGTITPISLEDGVSFSWDPVASAFMDGYKIRYCVQRVSNQKYQLGDVVVVNDMTIYTCIQAGTTCDDDPAPSWLFTGTITDGTVIWDTGASDYDDETEFPEGRIILYAGTDAVQTYHILRALDTGTTPAVRPTATIEALATDETATIGTLNIQKLGTSPGALTDWSVPPNGVDGIDWLKTVQKLRSFIASVTGLPWTRISSSVNKIDVFLTKREKEIQAHSNATICIWVYSVNIFGAESSSYAYADDECLNNLIDCGDLDP